MSDLAANNGNTTNMYLCLDVWLWCKTAVNKVGFLFQFPVRSCRNSVTAHAQITSNQQRLTLWPLYFNHPFGQIKCDFSLFYINSPAATVFLDTCQVNWVVFGGSKETIRVIKKHKKNKTFPRWVLGFKGHMTDISCFCAERPSVLMENWVHFIQCTSAF